MGRRVAVARQAPLHLERLGLTGERHLVYTTMAGDAGDAAIDMDRMVEKHKVGKLGNPIPGNGFSRGEALPD